MSTRLFLSQRPFVGGVASSSARCFKSSRPDPYDQVSLLESASDFFASLRWKAANALTSTLSDSERQELLKRLDHAKPEQKTPLQQQQQDTELIMKNSIAEAVAAARAQESQRNKEKWENQREKLLKEAEEAAVARIESDLIIQKRRIAFEKWKKELEAEKVSELEEKQVIATAEEQHPILGTCLLDLGYKRIYTTNASALANIPVWKKQRIYRHERAKAMAADKAKTMHLGLPGVIGLHEGSDGKLSILDGQHRVGMFTMLAKKKEAEGYLDRVLVEVYPQQDHHSENHAQEIFLEVNKAEPVKLVDLPGVAKSSDRKLLTDAAHSLHDKFPNMFSTSQKCRAPHLNLDNLRDTLFAGNVISRHDIKTAKALEEWMLEQNELLKSKYESDAKARKLVSKTALEKAKQFNFYLGLDSSWYYN